MKADDLREETAAGIRVFAEKIVRQVGADIGRRFREGNFSVEDKSDGTPVTEVDREVEEKLRDRISTEFPGHGFIGEEWGTQDAHQEFVWVLDPIDGTKSFVRGVPLFGTLVGLLFRGKPILGLIYQPVLDRMVVGDGRTTLLNGKEARVRSARSLDQSTLLYTDPSDPFFLGKRDAFSQLQEKASIVRSWGDCFGYLLLVAGAADIMMDPELSPWDLLPLLPVLRGAGAIVTAIDGKDPEEGNSLLATTGPSLHDEVIRTLFNESANE